MKILEKIKNFLFGKNEIKALPASEVDSKDYKSKIELLREDGTIVTITPQLDRLGNQQYEQVWSIYEKTMKYIPKFIVYADELKEIYGENCLGKSIVMDIDLSYMKHPQFAEYVANNVLNKKRMFKIIDQYSGYAGKINVRVNDEGGLDIYKTVDLSIVHDLKVAKQETMYQQMLEAEKQQRKTIEEQRKNISVHYKNDHAEDLSKIIRDDKDSNVR